MIAKDGGKPASGVGPSKKDRPNVANGDLRKEIREGMCQVTAEPLNNG